MSLVTERPSILIISKAKHRATLARVLEENLQREVFEASDLSEAKEMASLAIEAGHHFSTIVLDDGPSIEGIENSPWVNSMLKGLCAKSDLEKT